MTIQTARITLCAFALCLVATLALRADDPAPPKMTHEQRVAIVNALKWQTGTVALKGGLAKINLGTDFRYLDSVDSNKVLHDLWRNPEDPSVLGMIFPVDKGPMDQGNWAAIISYSDEGYVKDDDADKINYTDLLKKMQAETRDANAERQKEGGAPLELVGWAEPPHYDKATHKLYWAKDLKAIGEDDHGLNYDIRILGRHGVLVLTALGDIGQLQEIKDKTPELLSMVDFQPGNTYAEFDPKIDKIAEYGLTGLIAGGAIAAAAKLGLFGLAFKWIIAAVLALKKVLIIAVVAIVAGVKKFWGKITGKSGNS